MSIDYTSRTDVCSKRYEQRRTDGKAGWSDEGSYIQGQQTIEEILARNPLPKRCRFLEMGCGNGNFTLYMAGKGHEAYGIDIVPEAIAWAKQRAQEMKAVASFAVGDVVTLSPYPDGFFDFVFDAGCFIMILGDDRQTCLANVFRVLKHGGLVYVEAHLVNEEIKTRTIFSGQDYFEPQGQYSTVQGQPMYYFSREQEFVDIIKSTGFRIVGRKKEPRLSEDETLPFYAGDMWVEALKP